MTVVPSSLIIDELSGERRWSGKALGPPQQKEKHNSNRAPPSAVSRLWDSCRLESCLIY